MRTSIPPCWDIFCTPEGILHNGECTIDNYLVGYYGAGVFVRAGIQHLLDSVVYTFITKIIDQLIDEYMDNKLNYNMRFNGRVVRCPSLIFAKKKHLRADKILLSAFWKIINVFFGLLRQAWYEEAMIDKDFIDSSLYHLYKSFPWIAEECRLPYSKYPWE